MQVNHEENKIYLINMLASFADQLPTDNELEERLLQFCLHVFFFQSFLVDGMKHGSYFGRLPSHGLR